MKNVNENSNQNKRNKPHNAVHFKRFHCFGLPPCALLYESAHVDKCQIICYCIVPAKQ